MNKEDLHDIQEKISERQKQRIIAEEFARSLANFRSGLEQNGFTENESFSLTMEYMIAAVQNSAERGE